MTSRPSTAAPILAVLAIGLVTLGVYVGGYFWLGERHDMQFGTIQVSSIAELERMPPSLRLRNFPHKWEAEMFKPLASVESWWCGFPVNSVERNWRVAR
jgi:hypothetical protein